MSEAIVKDDPTAADRAPRPHLDSDVSEYLYNMLAFRRSDTVYHKDKQIAVPVLDPRVEAQRLPNMALKKAVYAKYLLNPDAPYDSTAVLRERRLEQVQRRRQQARRQGRGRSVDRPMGSRATEGGHPERRQASEAPPPAPAEPATPFAEGTLIANSNEFTDEQVVENADLDAAQAVPLMIEDLPDQKADVDMVEVKRELSSSSGSPRSSGGEEHPAVRQPWTKRTYKTGRRRQPRRSSTSRSRASSESLPPLAAVPLLVPTRTLARKILQPRPPGRASTAQLRNRSLEEVLGEADEYAAIHLADARELQHDPLAEETLMDALRRAAELETSYYAASLALPLPPRAHWFARRRSRSETGNAELNANAAERRKGSTLNPLAARFTLLSPFQQLTLLSSRKQLILLSSFKQLSLLSSFKQHVGRAGRSRPTRAPSDAGPVPWTCRQVSRTRVRKAACLRHQGSSVPGSHTVWLGFGLTRPWLGSAAQGAKLIWTWPQRTVPEATQWVWTWPRCTMHRGHSVGTRLVLQVL